MAQEVILKLRIEDGELDQLKGGLEELGADFSVVETEAKKVDDSFKKIGKSSFVFDQLNKLTDGLAGNVVDVYNGLVKMNIGLRATRTALIATGIGAFVVALGTIVAYWDDIVGWITGANDELEIQKRLQDDINRQLERRNELEDDRKRFIDNETKEKLLRAKIAGAGEDELTAIQREGLVKRIADLEELGEEANRILEQTVGADLETYEKALAAQKDIFKKIGQARGDLTIFDLEQQIKDPTRGADQEKAQTLPTSGVTLTELEELGNLEFDALALQQTARNNMEQASSKYRIWLAEQESMAKVESYMIAANGFAAASDLIGRETAAGKAFAVASTLISTYLAAQQAYASQLTIPTPDAPFRAAAAASVAVLSGLANVKQILSTKIPGYGGGGSVGGSPSRPPAFNVVGASGQNQLNQALLQRNSEPVEAFVVEGAVSSAEELRRNKITTSSIG